MEGGERFIFGLLGLRFLVFSLGWGWWSKIVLWVVFVVVFIECVFIVCFDILNFFFLFYLFFFDFYFENFNKIFG